MLQTLGKVGIEVFQSYKKIFVDTYVKHEDLKKTLHNFVDAQTEYTKKVYDNTIETGQSLYDILSDSSFYMNANKDLQEKIHTFFNTQMKGK